MKNLFKKNKGSRKLFKKMLIIFSVFILVLTFNKVYAEVPNNINYQGKLKDNVGVPITSATSIQFSLYNHLTNGAPTDVPSAGGSLLWTETYDQANGNCSQIIPGVDGIFSQLLGTCVTFPSYLDFTDEYYLGVKIGADAEATPRVPLSTNPYAYTSKRVHTTNEDLHITTETSGNILLNTATGMQINSSNAGFQGATYAADYSANFVARSLVDKAYVDGLISSTKSIWDGDHDTGIQVEKNPDEDIIRFNTLGGQRAKIDNAGNVLFSNLDPADLLNPGALTGLLFRNDKASMRVGEATAGTEWNDANIGNGTFASGEDNVVSGWYSAAFGGNNNINDSYSVAMGRNNTITSSYSVAGGFQNSSAGYASMVFGQTNQVSDTRAAAWGLDNTASEREATAWGRNTEASAPYATSWGRDTVASGEHSTAFGYQNTASDDYGLAFGYNNTASGRYATVWGGQNTASGQYSTAWGSHNTASGAHSTAIGYYSEASAENATAIGDALANSNYMTAIGRFNEDVAGQDLTNWVDTDQLFVIGNGTGWQNANRSNALTILKNGTITAPTFSLAEINTAGNTALTTKEYVDNAILSGTNNIYTDDGTLTGSRTLNANNHSLAFNDLSWFGFYSNNGNGEIEFDGGIMKVAAANTGEFELGHQDSLLWSITPTVSDMNIRATNVDTKITDNRATTKGFEYAADYSAGFTDRTLVDKAYVDGQLMWEIVNGGEIIQPKNNSIKQIFVEENSNSYTQFKVRNNNDTGNGAGAIIELKGSGADYTNNMYIGKYGASFWIPELQDNGAVLTDKNLVIGTASDTKEIHFVTGHSYTNLAPVVIADDEGFRYTSDLSATFVDRTLVDKEYVDNAILSGTNNIYTDDGTLTGNRNVSLDGKNLVFSGSGNIGIGTTNPNYKLTVGGGAIMLDSIATPPTASQGFAGIYASSGELQAFDESGNSTQISPHDENNYWIYNSKNVNTGESLYINMEKMMKALDEALGGGYVFVNNKAYFGSGEVDENKVNGFQKMINDLKSLLNRVLGIEEKVDEIDVLKSELCQKDDTYTWCQSQQTDDSDNNDGTDNSGDTTTDDGTGTTDTGDTANDGTTSTDDSNNTDTSTDSGDTTTDDGTGTTDDGDTVDDNSGDSTVDNNGGTDNSADTGDTTTDNGTGNTDTSGENI